MDFLRMPELRKHLLILIVIETANSLASYGLELNSMNFKGAEHLNYFLIVLPDFPAIFLGWYMLEGRLGRRWTNVLALMLSGVCLCVPSLLDPSKTILITIFSMLGKLGSGGSSAIIFQQSAEIFPTTLRSQGMGICTVVSSLGIIGVPYITYLVNIEIF